MTLIEVLALLTLLGGAIFATFEITWKISHDDKKPTIYRDGAWVHRGQQS